MGIFRQGKSQPHCTLYSFPLSKQGIGHSLNFLEIDEAGERRWSSVLTSIVVGPVEETNSQQLGEMNWQYCVAEGARFQNEEPAARIMLDSLINAQWELKNDSAALWNTTDCDPATNYKWVQ